MVVAFLSEIREQFVGDSMVRESNSSVVSHHDTPVTPLGTYGDRGKTAVAFALTIAVTS
jgi:hypothetical protein